MQTPVQLISVAASVVVIAVTLWPRKTASLRDLATAHRDLIERVEALAGGQDGDPDTVLPIYTRASDAEENEARRTGGAGKGRSS